MSSSPIALQSAAMASLARGELASHDALLVIAPSPLHEHVRSLGPAVASAVAAALRIDAGLERGPRAPVVLSAPGVPGERLVLAPLGKLEREVDDVRAIAEAAAAAAHRAADAGARRAVLAVVAPGTDGFAHATEVATLAALGTGWSPLEAREAEREPTSLAELTVLGLHEPRAEHLAALDRGRWVCRDVTGTESERMTPRKVASYCRQAFAGTGVGVEVTEDIAGYPLLGAVARASMVVERHRPCVVKLEHSPSGEVRRTVLIAAKGVTYDTGGADLKTDGSMAGMSRDKGGAGAAAGLLRAVAGLGLRHVRVVALLGLVRNSIGEEAFVSDEIITSRAGVRVRIGNTDAEGRLVLADLLAEARELAKGAPQPIVLSVATLTGHVYRAYGPYGAALGNAAARDRGVMAGLAGSGELWGEPFELSRPRREDYTLVAARSPAEDVVSSNRLASVNTPRGHQFPFAFLDIAAGLRGTGLPFCHLDIGGIVVDPPDWQHGRPTGAPVLALARYLQAMDEAAAG